MRPDPDFQVDRRDAACQACRLCQGPQLWGTTFASADYLVALAGCPNVGKSTVFNALTGMRQHTGNWPGKTVARAEGGFEHSGKRYRLVDLPGTYTLITPQAEEHIAHDALVYGRPDVTVIVVDASQLERNLSFVLQVLEVTDRAIVCLNLVDEAKRHGMQVDADALARQLGVPVVETVARYGRGIARLRKTIAAVAANGGAKRRYRFTSADPELDALVNEGSCLIEAAYPGVPASRWIALHLLDGEPALTEAVRNGELANLVQPSADSADTIPTAPDTGPVAPGTPVPLAVVAPAAARDVGAAVLASGQRLVDWFAQARSEQAGFYDHLLGHLHAEASRIAARVTAAGGRRWTLDHTIDRLVTSRWLGFPMMLGMLTVVLWLTIAGANVPSGMLSNLFLGTVYPALKAAAAAIGLPAWLSGLLIDGVYLSTAWVVSVMLPPMAIFFPLFTLLEDSGYLARVAFNLDHLFHRVGAHGKQALTMSMGFGCNAAGVIATRIIDSPRERLIAIITNNFALCNGRWPTQILIATIFVGAMAPPYLAGLVSAAAVVGVALLGIVLTFVVSWALTHTVLRGEASTFSLELPPYRRPRILQTLYTSLIDRTVFVLWRAVLFAMPAGAAIWLSANVHFGGASIAEHLVHWLDPIAWVVGLNGVILLAYVLAIPANEVVIPTVLMLTVLTGGVGSVGSGTGVLFELDSAHAIGQLLIDNGGWTLLTALNLMLFSLIHNPCSTTIYTIYKETGSARWTAVASLLPVALGFATTFLVATVWRLLA